MLGRRRFHRLAMYTLGLLPLTLSAARADESPLRGDRTPRVESERGPRGHQFVTRSPRRCGIRFTHRVRNVSEAPLEDLEVTLAVPVSSARQDIHSVYFEPRPSCVENNVWGQRTATFRLGRLEANAEVEVHLTTDATLWDLQWLISERDLGSADETPNSVLRHFLRDGRDYRIDETILRQAAQRVGSPDEGLLEQVRRIHDFVMDSLDYERDARWDPADEVLRRGRGSCSEYSYLMIALCRLHGVPARYAGGTWIEPSPGGSEAPNLSDGTVHVDRVFHRWVEVYLPRLGWFPVDATRDDMASADGAPYRYFGRLPWYHLTLYRGDGGELIGNQLGSDYRSNTRWRGYGRRSEARAVVERFAVWSDKTDRSLVAARPTPDGLRRSPR